MSSSAAIRIECPECVRLCADRDYFKRVYDLAEANLRAAAGQEAGQYLILKTLADEAGLDLDRADVAITQHREGHNGLSNSRVV